MRKLTSPLMLQTALVVALSGAFTLAQAPQTTTQGQPTKPFEPTQGQAGKDVVWLPTDQRLVDKMLDLAKVTPQDFLIDLGSGDGRTVITAAKRGLRAEGIEYNPDMVDFAKRNAVAAGVADRATFVRGDIFETDFSKADVLTLFLLPQLNERLRPTILKMKPGTRVVSNSFTMGDWEADQQDTISNCTVSFCTAILWIVPAQVAGTWQVGIETLTLEQKFQVITGRLGGAPLSGGKLNGTEISFAAGGKKYTGKVDGTSISGTIDGGGSWTATRKT
jgi:hypothetical protein